MPNLDKVCRLGRGPYGNVFVHIVIDNGRLSITGVEGPKSNGDCRGSAGQIGMSPCSVTDYAPGWDADRVTRLWDDWGNWHLNDMQAGSPAQTAWLKANPVKYTYPESHYEKASLALLQAGLNPDPNYLHNGQPYRYGSAWLKVDVPADVLERLAALPDTDITPVWV